jgi:phosphoribosyl 1,2-cyclic phosphate phosphodiesterase
MKLRLTILGCGSSGGVPRIGPMWGACDPTNPKNRRLRCSALLERIGRNGRTSVLIDTSPDLREQLLSVRADRLDAVLFTHDHADHTHGIDDIRAVAYAMKGRIPAYFDAETGKSLKDRFGYCFKTPDGSGYPPILDGYTIGAGDTVSIKGPGGEIQALAIPQMHGDITSLGFRFGGIAYSPDISGLPESSVPMLEGLAVWVVDALRYTRHESHFSVKEALGWIERIKPKRAILTHMTGELDYTKLARELPQGVEPAYDGMVIDAGK